MIEISGDSGEYEMLTEAVALSAGVEGMCIEIGLRRGMGTKYIIDAVRQYCPNKMVVSVDPFGSIPYVGREHVGEIRLDYDNPMKIDTMIAMWSYVRENPVDWRPEILTDYAFFEKYAKGVPKYDIDESIEEWYSMAHLDAQHTVSDVSRQILWFNDRMKKGSIITVDDVTIDFFDIKPIQALFVELGWNEVKMGSKKGLWQKC